MDSLNGALTPNPNPPKRSYGVTAKPRATANSSSSPPTPQSPLTSAPSSLSSSIRTSGSNIPTATPSAPLKSALHSSSAKNESSNSWWERMRVKTLNRRVAVQEGSIFEAFMIVGLPPDPSAISIAAGEVKSLPPQIIYQYPNDSKIETSNVSHFCFPQGVPVKGLARTRSNSSLQELMFSSLQRIEVADHSFVFLLSTGEQFLYGVCVYKDELVEDAPSLYGASETSPKVKERNVSPSAPRCYVLLSKFPYFNVHLNVLYTFLGRDHLIRINREMSDDRDQSLVSAQDLKKLLTYYRGLQVPVNSRLIIELPNEKAFPFFCSVNEDDIIADACFALLLRIVKPEQLLTLLTALLLERHIVIVCKYLGLLSAVCFSLIPLMHPFAWQGPFIPVLPQIMQDCLEAPVPCVLGVQQLSPEQRSLLSDAVLLELDGDTVLSSSSRPLPSLPHLPLLLERLNLRYEHASISLGASHRAKATPWKHSGEMQRIAKEVLEEVRVWCAWLIEGLTQLIPTRDFALSDAKQQVILIEGCSPEHQEFVMQLLAAQHLHVYMELHLQGEAGRGRPKARSISTPKVLHGRTTSTSSASPSSPSSATQSSPLTASTSPPTNTASVLSVSPAASTSALPTLSSSNSGSIRKNPYYQTRSSQTEQEKPKSFDTSMYGRL